MHTKPKWPYDLINERDARWFLEHDVYKIEHKTAMTSPDTSVNWIELYHRDSKTPRKMDALPWGVRFDPSYRGLLYIEGYVADAVRKVEQWEEENARDRAELARLKKKLGVD